MRPVVLLASSLALSAVAARGQLHVGAYEFASFGASFGVDEDRVRGMDADYFFRSAGVEAAPRLRELIDASEVYSMVCENPMLRVDVSLRDRAKELRLGLYGIFHRLDGISHFGGSGYYDLETIGHELGLEGAHLWRSNLWRHFHAYGGAGVQLGYGFGTKLHGYTSAVSTLEDISFRANGGDVVSNQQLEDTYVGYDDYGQFDVPNALHGRAFAVAGLAFDICDRLEFNTEGRFGYGFRQNAEAGAATQLRSWTMGLRWNVRTPEELGTWESVPAGEWY